MNRLLTILGRPSKRTRSVLPVLLAVLLALSVSCSKDYEQCFDCPTTPSLIPGSFVLVAVDGKILPYNPPNSNVTFLAGDCVTTSEKFTLNMQTITVSGGKSDTTTAATTGFVLALNRGSVTFHFSASSVQAPALITGNGFMLTYQGLTLLFERIG
jgi:hypothetical protein